MLDGSWIVSPKSNFPLELVDDCRVGERGGDIDRHRLAGTVGLDVDLETAQKAARLSAINILAHLQQALVGDWDKLIGCLKINGF